ncbi:hypothetical protein RN001_003734 [Aquatica leii]|uniref:Zinc finger PHD-type domain-containing protein n=1 Tax=Aquatica leii TaxID=1421715 RepID=A0AAN7QP95_9COLE|nr:hypothetical protein RN001_003734 [Aquatica leii]
MPSELLEVSSEIPVEPPEVSNINFTEETNMKKSESTQNYNQPSCSFGETLQIISPKPTRPKQTKRVVRRKETSEILTSTPVKDALERQEEDRKKIVKPKPRTELQTNKKIKIVKSKPNRKEMEASTSKLQDESSEESDSASDVDCLYCVSKYSASRGGEGWIQCQGCRNWAHEECAGIDDFEDEFLCLILQGIVASSSSNSNATLQPEASTLNSSVPLQINPTIKKQFPKTPRKKLVYAAVASENYRKSLDQKNEIKKYYEKKLVILERIAVAKEKSAARKENMVEYIANISQTMEETHDT